MDILFYDHLNLKILNMIFHDIQYIKYSDLLVRVNMSETWSSHFREGDFLSPKFLTESERVEFSVKILLPVK